MAIWMHNLEFNVATGSIHHLIRPGMESTVFCRKSCGTLVITSRIRSYNFSIVWDFARYTSSLAQPHRKKSQPETWTSCRPFVWSSSSQPTSRKLPIQPGTYDQCKVWWWVIVHENKFIDVFPARYDRPHVIFQHLKMAFGIHGVTQKVWADDLSGRHYAPHGHFWTILQLLQRHFGIVCRPVMTIMSIDETADIENGLVAPENVFEEFWPILVPTQHQLPISHSAVTVFRCQLLHVMGFPRAKIQVSLTP